MNRKFQSNLKNIFFSIKTYLRKLSGNLFVPEMTQKTTAFVFLANCYTMNRNTLLLSFTSLLSMIKFQAKKIRLKFHALILRPRDIFHFFYRSLKKSNSRMIWRESARLKNPLSPVFYIFFFLSDFPTKNPNSVS